MKTGLNAKVFTDNFDQIYVINLPERTDRKKEVSRELGKVGLSLESPLVQLFPAVRPEDKGPFPSIGARGCFLSHVGVLESAVEANFNSILILEDDADWTRAALTRGGSLAESLKESDWNFLHGGLGDDASSSKIDDFHLKPLGRRESVLLAHFIGIRGEAIAVARDYLHEILGRPPGSPLGGPMHVDGAYNWLRKDTGEIKACICVPSVAKQRPSASDITPHTGFKALPLVSSILAIVRKLRKL